MAFVRSIPFLSLILLHLLLLSCAAFVPSHLIAPRDDLAKAELLDRLQLAKTNDDLAPDEQKYISKFVDVADGEKYGWTTEVKAVRLENDLIFRHFSGVDAVEASQVTWTHSKDSIVDGKRYKQTDGKFLTKVNPHAGLIVALDSKSPASEAPFKGIDPDDIVPLSKWSDVVFLQWLDQAEKAGVPPQNIKVIGRDVMLNQQSRDVFNGILFRRFGKDKTPPNWDERFTLHADDPREREDFLRLLQTPNGAGCAFLLAGHKAILGAKRLVSVTLWTDIKGQDTDEDQDVEAIIQDPAKKEPLRESLQRMYPKYLSLQRQAAQTRETWKSFMESHKRWLEEARADNANLMTPEYIEWLEDMLGQSETQYALLDHTRLGYEEMLEPMTAMINAWEKQLEYGYYPNMYFIVEDEHSTR